MFCRHSFKYDLSEWLNLSVFVKRHIHLQVKASDGQHYEAHLTIIIQVTNVTGMSTFG